jgi:hypothetical protein
MVIIEELSEDTAYLVKYVFRKDTDILLSSFEYNGIEAFEDFMSFDPVDVNQPYSTLEKPDTLLSLSSSLIKKLLSV